MLCGGDGRVTDCDGGDGGDGGDGRVTDCDCRVTDGVMVTIVV